MNRKDLTLKRLKREYELCSNDKDLAESIEASFSLIDGNYYKWKVTIVGPMGTPYEYGLFSIKIIFPEDYPRHGAEFKFINKIYHSNVDWGKDFGHISHCKIYPKNKIFLVRNFNICEIREINHNFSLVNSFVSFGDEVYAIDIFFEHEQRIFIRNDMSNFINISWINC